MYKAQILMNFLVHTSSQPSTREEVPGGTSGDVVDLLTLPHPGLEQQQHSEVAGSILED